MKNKTTLRFAALIFSSALFLQTCPAQLALTGTNYLQNFDAISNGLPPFWSVRTNATAVNAGLAADFTSTNRTHWITTTGQFANYPSTVSNSGTNYLGDESTTIQENCTNRAPGIRQTGLFGDPGAAFVCNITNTLGRVNFQLSLDFLMLSVQTHSTVWTLDYAVGANATNFIPLATYADPGVFGATHTNISFGAALDNQSSNVWIRIAALNPSTGSTGSRDTFGVDNFSLAWSNVVTPPVITGIVLTNGSAQIYFTGGANDTASSFLLQTAGEMSGAFGDAAAVINQLGSTQFDAVCGTAGAQQFFRVKHQ
jgi:hypothetical protein